MTRPTPEKVAWIIGRSARLRGYDLHHANVTCARKFGVGRRDLLDECEHGWHYEDELRAQRENAADNDAAEAGYRDMLAHPENVVDAPEDLF